MMYGVLADNLQSSIKKNGIYNAKQLKNKSNTWIKKCSNVLSSRTAMEQKFLCIGLETTQTKGKVVWFQDLLEKELKSFKN